MDGSWMAYPPRFPRKLIIVEGRTGCSALLCSAHPRQGGRDTITQFSGSAVGMNLVKKGRIAATATVQKTFLQRVRSWLLIVHSLFLGRAVALSPSRSLLVIH